MPDERDQLPERKLALAELVIELKIRSCDLHPLHWARLPSSRHGAATARHALVAAGQSGSMWRPTESTGSHMSHAFRVDPRRVVGETIDGETILVDLETGAYYSLKGSGPEIWGLVAAGCSEDAVVEEFRRRRPDDGATVATQTSALIDQLHAEGCSRRSC
jgi:hypothetical protein